LKNIDGTTSWFDYAFDMTVRMFNDLICEQIGYAVDSCYFLFRGRRLEDGRTLASFGLLAILYGNTKIFRVIPLAQGVFHCLKT
jgi:hypothetical protein